MNITLSLDEYTVARARLVAQASGKSLNQLIREYIQDLAGSADIERTCEELQTLWQTGMGSSNGKKVLREDAYD